MLGVCIDVCGVVCLVEYVVCCVWVLLVMLRGSVCVCVCVYGVVIFFLSVMRVVGGSLL